MNNITNKVTHCGNPNPTPNNWQIVYENDQVWDMSLQKAAQQSCIVWQVAARRINRKCKLWWYDEPTASQLWIAKEKLPRGKRTNVSFFHVAAFAWWCLVGSIGTSQVCSREFPCRSLLLLRGWKRESRWMAALMEFEVWSIKWGVTFGFGFAFT